MKESVQMANKAWYALRVQSEREEKIKESLIARIRAKGLEQYVAQIVVPAENVQDMREGKRRVVQQKMFPGYILIEVSTSDGGDVPQELLADPVNKYVAALFHVVHVPSALR